MKKACFHHYRSVTWVLPNGPLSEAYTAVVEHDECPGCVVCDRTAEWFMEFARVAKDLVGINLRDCLHWGSLFDNPRPLIVPTSILHHVNQEVLARLRSAYYALPERDRPVLAPVGLQERHFSPSERFEDRLAILSRMIELWEDQQYIGWPS